MAETAVNQKQNKALVNTSTFAEMVFVGVKKAESFSIVSDDSEIFEDVLEAIEKKQHKGKVMLGFFSIPNLAGESIEKIDTICNFNENVNENMLRQSLKKVALIDFSEAKEDTSSVVNILVVADCIVHWDNQGSYIQPTDDHSFLFDLEDILSMYPSSYKVNIYSNKDLSSFKAREFEQKKVTDIPVMQEMWYNQPSFQQIYGNIVLVAGLATMAIAYGTITWQKSSIEDLNSKISNFQSVKINDSFYNSSNKNLQELSKDIKYKDINSLVLKDLSYGINTSGFHLDKLSFEHGKKDKIIANIVSKLNKHTQFSAQEPIARRIIDNSLFIKAIRKKLNKEQRLEFEAMVDLNQAKEEIQKLNKGRG